MDIFSVNENNFKEEILQAEEPILVDFYADWCSHCKKISPVLEQLSEEKQLRIAKVNVDESPHLTRQYNIMSIPALLLFENGEPQTRQAGNVSKEEILAMCSKNS